MKDTDYNYHYGFNFSDPLASFIHQNYIEYYEENLGTTLKDIRSIVNRSISIEFTDEDNFIKVLEEFSKKPVYFDGDDYIFISDGAVIFKITYTSRKKFIDIDVNVYATTFNKAKEWLDIFDNFLTPYKVNIASFSVDWKYNGGSYKTTEYVDDIIHPEAYPVIKDINKFVEDYIKSSEPILILRGKTGSGKTRLIRSILRDMSNMKEDDYSSISVSYTMDDTLLMSDGFFVDFLNSNYDVLVLEDLDEYLKSRKEGNNTMSKLLTVSDGIVQSVDKKIIISTNLNTIGEFDEALLREGRCFANVRFRKLDWGESKKLIFKLSPDFDIFNLEQKEYSVAEIYEITSGKNVEAETEDEGKHFSNKVGFS